ncbi:FtsL-like putative cell division protein [Hymenobacter cheonanensis]|uniref:FtsL-like putative cell division protein n=1 Tax=Hymenobacter sp. CA2-7 TaxID=3063993 RepID=UPI002712546D|nr:FtsL-like putative cell division protein [Hymenobacter sp. CA2-7]MDO7885754.1 FtsL-like putative cell division protein [Hymenobacter sp. CA2-7]
MRKPAPAPVEFTAPAWDRNEGVTATGWSLFSLLDRFTGLDGLFREGLPVRFLPKLLFVMLLILLYIGNTHYGNRMNRNIQRLKQETEDLRADYTTLKSDYMEASKQSEVARKVAAIGLVESSSPPFRIAVPAGRLDEAQLETMPVLTADTLAARAARDSVASVRADSIQGRARRQQLGLPADDTPELGAPPPGLAPEDSASGPATNANRLATRIERKSAAAKKQPDSTKKHKTVQTVPGRSAKADFKKSSHERQR